MNSVTILATITETEMRYTQGGYPILNVGLAGEAVSDEGKPQKFYVPKYNATVFGKTAENAVNWSGKNVAAVGQLRYRQWATRDGEPRNQLDIVFQNMALLNVGEIPLSTPDRNGATVMTRAMNRVIIYGNATSDARVSPMKTGGNFTNLRVAVSQQRFRNEAGDWDEPAPIFVNCKAFNKPLAEGVRKGDSVLIEGAYGTERYEDKNGNSRYSEFLVAYSVIPLTRTTAGGALPVDNDSLNIDDEFPEEPGVNW